MFETNIDKLNTLRHQLDNGGVHAVTFRTCDIVSTMKHVHKQYAHDPVDKYNNIIAKFLTTNSIKEYNRNAEIIERTYSLRVMMEAHRQYRIQRLKNKETNRGRL